MIALIVLSILGSLVLLFASLNAAANYDKWAEAQYQERISAKRNNQESP